MSNVNLTVNAFPDGHVHARGYVRDDVPWTVANLGDLHVVAAGADELSVLERWADALRAGLAQARQAQQDADLADLVRAVA